MPDPYIIEQNQEKRKKQEPHVTHSGIMGVRYLSQPQTAEEKTVKIIEYTRDMSDESFINAVAKMMMSRQNVDYKRNVVPRIESIKQAKLAKETKRLQDIERQNTARNTQPYKLLEDFWDSTRGGYTMELTPYQQMSVKKLGLLLDMLEKYDPDKQHHRGIKGEVATWLRNLITKRQSLSEPEQPKGKHTLKIPRIFRRS